MKEEDFTIKSILKYWLHIWPISVAVLLIGLLLGVAQALALQDGIKIEEKILIKNGSAFNINADDYLAIINNYVVPQYNNEETGCDNNFKVNGNVLTITTICSGNSEEAISQSELLRTAIINSLNKIYDGDINEIVLSSSVPQNTVSLVDRFKKFLVPVVAALATSAAITIFGLDKNNGLFKKDSRKNAKK